MAVAEEVGCRRAETAEEVLEEQASASCLLGLLWDQFLPVSDRSLPVAGQILRVPFPYLCVSDPIPPASDPYFPVSVPYCSVSDQFRVVRHCKTEHSKCYLPQFLLRSVGKSSVADALEMAVGGRNLGALAGRAIPSTPVVLTPSSADPQTSASCAGEEWAGGPSWGVLAKPGPQPPGVLALEGREEWVDWRVERAPG